MKLKTLKSPVQQFRSAVSVVQAVTWRTDKQSSSKRGYGYAWQKARVGYLASHPLCVYCEREGRVTAATVVDHIVAHRGDQALFWDKENWQSLCATHHSRDKQREEAQASGDVIDGATLVREVSERRLIG